MRDIKTLKVIPVTTPAKLRRVEELLSEVTEILVDFQDEIEAAGHEDEDLSNLLDALDEPFGLDGPVTDLASKLADDYAAGRTPDELIYSAEEFDETDETDEASDSSDGEEDGQRVQKGA